jgi:hypothetical protein
MTNRLQEIGTRTQYKLALKNFETLFLGNLECKLRKKNPNFTWRQVHYDLRRNPSPTLSKHLTYAFS